MPTDKQREELRKKNERAKQEAREVEEKRRRKEAEKKKKEDDDDKAADARAIRSALGEIAARDTKEAKEAEHKKRKQYYIDLETKRRAMEAEAENDRKAHQSAIRQLSEDVKEKKAREDKADREKEARRKEKEKERDDNEMLRKQLKEMKDDLERLQIEEKKKLQLVDAQLRVDREYREEQARKQKAEKDEIDRLNLAYDQARYARVIQGVIANPPLPIVSPGYFYDRRAHALMPVDLTSARADPDRAEELRRKDRLYDKGYFG